MRVGHSGAGNLPEISRHAMSWARWSVWWSRPYLEASQSAACSPVGQSDQSGCKTTTNKRKCQTTNFIQLCVSPPQTGSPPQTFCRDKNPPL